MKEKENAAMRQYRKRRPSAGKMVIWSIVSAVVCASVVSLAIICAYKSDLRLPAWHELGFGGEASEAALPSGSGSDGVEEDAASAPMQRTPQLEGQEGKILSMDWGGDVEISFYIKNLETKETLIHNSKKMNSASLIKLFIMLEAFERDNDGTIPFTPEIKDEIKKMITKSDNEASRKLTDIYYPKHVEALNVTKGDIKNAGLITEPISYASKGFPSSVMERKMHDRLPPGGATGKNNWTSVEDIGKLLEMIYNKECVSKQASEQMLLLLKQQERTNKIPKLIKEKQLPVIVANKTGELNQVENDAAIITGEGIDDFIFVIMIGDIPYDENNRQQSIALKKKITDNIAQISLDLVSVFEKK